MELLEKRVRSRFSHRKQLVPEMGDDFDKAGDNPKDVLTSMLSVPENHDSQQQVPDAVQQWNAAMQQTLQSDAVLQQLRLMINQGTMKCV